MQPTIEKQEETKFYQKLGERLKVLRKSRMYSQEEFAKEIGTSRVGYSNIEKGKQRLPLYSYHKIAALYGLSIDQLINETAIKNDVDILQYKTAIVDINEIINKLR